MFMQISFSSSLSSQLAVFHVSYPFKTLDGVLIGTGKGTTLNSFLNAWEGSIRRKIADKIIRPNPRTIVSGFQEGIDKMMTEKYGFMSSAGQIRNSIKNGCSFMEIPYDLNNYDIAFGFPKQFPFSDLFNFFISKNFENGNLQRIKSKWLKRANKMCHAQTQLDSMGFDNVVSAFFMVIIGVIITLVIFCSELCVAKVKRTIKYKNML